MYDFFRQSSSSFFLKPNIFRKLRGVRFSGTSSPGLSHGYLEKPPSSSKRGVISMLPNQNTILFSSQNMVAVSISSLFSRMFIKDGKSPSTLLTWFLSQGASSFYQSSSKCGIFWTISNLGILCFIFCKQIRVSLFPPLDSTTYAMMIDMVAHFFQVMHIIW